ncbi:hypothetical protein [Bacillus thuringiensis]|uniref:hypothetical protein n=1 Tax=Bacillus thuringiensis TaxID=1428 RepID=UPI000BFE145B|nr:hypothetical protein [Bacillus thuringiensis]PGR97602.1 hypothetical protein COC68_12945 [Bacillus thuringiensis]
MEVIITNIGIESNEIIYMSDNNKMLDDIDLTVANVSFDMYKNGNRLNGEHSIPFEKYRKMNHDELIEHIKETFK